MKNKITLLIITLLLTGCEVTYNLDISNKGFEESFNIISNLDNKNEVYEIPAFIGIIEYEDIDANFLERVEEIEYYNNKSIIKNNKKIINYNYSFDLDNIIKSNAINSAYNNVIIKKYDHDNNGKNDYMMISTDDSFNILEKFNEIKKVEINITCHYEIISSNADKVTNNTHTWYLDKDNIKPINMVYNPDKVIDYRTFWQKLLDGDYFTPFTISIIILIIGSIIYLILKRKSNKVDAI